MKVRLLDRIYQTSLRLPVCLAESIEDGMPAQVGNPNQNQQQFDRRTTEGGTDHNQYV
jgi:hypothetical protein